MIRKSPTGLSPTIEVLVGDAPVDYEAMMSITLDYTTDNHDLCKIVLAGIPANSVTDYIGKSIRVKADTGISYVTTFYGTIEQVMPTHTSRAGKVNNNLLQEATLVCLGVSYAMRGSSSRSWRNYSLEDMARFFCNKYNLSLDIPSDPLIFPNMMQSLESDWNVLVRYCNSMGYCVTVHGTHMHIFDPHKAVGRSVSYHNLNTPTRTGFKPTPGQIIMFDARFTRQAADGVTIDAVATVHTDTGQVYDLRTSDILRKDTQAIYSNPLSVTVENYDQGERLIRAAHRTTYDYEATSVVVGVLGALPGGIVNLNRYDGEFDGLWYIDGVSHFIRTDEFTTTLSLRKSREDTLVDQDADAYTPPPVPVAIDNVWKTSMRNVNVYT